jgi:uncharacterized protein YuzE
MSDSFRVTYDPDEADCSYIYLTGTIAPGEVVRTETVMRDINLDFDAQGCLIGIELLSPTLLHPTLASKAKKPGEHA